MTSPTDPPREPLSSRISTRFARGGSSHSDPEERFTRNVTYLFVGLLVIVIVMILFGLIYGFWDANFRPVAQVAGSDVSRTQWEERVDLEAFRLQRAESQVRSALAAGSIDSDLAARRLAAISAQSQQVGANTIETLVDLIYQGKLAEEEGISLSETELETALAAAGSAPEYRRVSAIIVLPEGLQIGVPPTPEGRQEALAMAQAAAAALASGTPFAEVAAEYSSLAEEQPDGDLGFVEQSELSDAAWAEAVFAIEEGEVTDIFPGENGEYLIGTTTEIVPERPDPGFLDAVAQQVGERVNQDNVRLEATAAKLEAKITDAATSTPVEQVKLAEILVEGNTFIDPEADEGTIRASHILYAPGDPNSGETLAEDDPVWEEKRLLAEAAAEELRAIEDPAERADAFAARAATDSDGPTSTTGGDLGYFSRLAMVPEFADPLFENPDLMPGDIVGPVRSDFGWHVIQFTDRRAPILERVAAVEAALAAPGADFATVAMEYSDGAEAADGGETGWHILDDLDDLTLVELDQIDVGEVTPNVEGDDGYTFYLKQDLAERPLDPRQAAYVAETAFVDWYQERRFEAEDEGRISIDSSFFGLDAPDPNQFPQGLGG